MSLFLCKLWPYLFGGLIGWVLCGLLARKLKYREPPEEKIIEKEVVVEKVVDNPEHLALINNLQIENKNINLLRNKVAELESRKPEVIEKKVEVEKSVDNPLHLTRITELETELNIWRQGPTIDLPAARAAGISISNEDDFTAIEGIGPKINELIHEDGIHTFKHLSDTETSRLQQILDSAGSNYQMANPGTWPDQANLAASNRWAALKALQDILIGGVYPDPSSADSGTSQSTGSDANYIARIAELEDELKTYRDQQSQKRESNADVSSAKLAGFSLRQRDGRDDFTVIEGIGPKINELIHAEDIHFYNELARTDVADLQRILDKAGPNFSLAEPTTWPAQSDLAAKNQWHELKKWQDELDGGKQ